MFRRSCSAWRATFGKRRIICWPGQLANWVRTSMQEEGQPDTLSFPLRTHEIETIVPIAAPNKGQTMFAELESMLDGADTMFVECSGFRGAHGQIEVTFLFRLHRPAFQKGNLFVQDTRVIQASNVAARRIREPSSRRKYACARPVRWRMPPMLHVSLTKLMSSGPQQLLAQESWLRMHQSHRVLQLIAKTVSPARLVKPGAAPQSATQCLIKQPAIGQYVHRCVRRFHIHCAQSSSPIGPDFFEGGTSGIGAAARIELALPQIASGPRQSWFPFLSCGEIKAT